MSDDLPDLPANAFAKHDPAPDRAFYVTSRFVTHIDDAAIEGVTALYRTLLPSGGVVLDLMSSWVSHLPSDVEYAAVLGHGMNAAELMANPRLSRWFVQDLNEDPALPIDSQSVDAVTMCVSVQYLQRPVAVLREARRVLRPGGCIVITFSNRCFPTKAVALWTSLDDAGHKQLVSLYLQRAGFDRIEAVDAVRAAAGGDPLYAVVGWSAPGKDEPHDRV